MTVAELIAVLLTQDQQLEVKIIIQAGTFPGQANDATLELRSVTKAIPHNGKRQVQIVTAE